MNDPAKPPATRSRFVTLKLSDIRVGDRIRSFPGDLGALRESMDRIGLLNPIVVDGDHRLIAGYRRLTAAKQLGWSTIDAKVVGGAGQDLKLLMEIAENTTRLDFSAEQQAFAERKLARRRLRGPAWKLVTWIFG